MHERAPDDGADLIWMFDDRAPLADRAEEIAERNFLGVAGGKLALIIMASDEQDGHGIAP